jgi:hypothetical protein
MPVLPRPGHEIGELVEELKWRELDDAIGPRPGGLSAAAGPDPAEGAATKLTVGDELVVRLDVTSDRDYEFLELADHRPSLTEPVDVLSGWRCGDGVGWYVAIRDASTQLFFERLPRGTHVFEYSLRAAHRGSGSSGFARIQSRYPPSSPPTPQASPSRSGRTGFSLSSAKHAEACQKSHVSLWNERSFLSFGHGRDG